MTPTNWQKKSDQDFHITDFTAILIRQAEQDRQTLRKPTSKFSKVMEYPINRGRLIHPLKTALIMFSAFYAMVKKKLVFLFIRVVKMSSNLWNFRSYTEAGEPEKTGLDHFSDCVRYLCWRCFNPLHLGAGRKTGIRIY